MFKKLLIANRGEIAVRIMKTARRLGIATVAVYSEADTNALFVQEADEAVFIGPSPSTQSYLCIDKIIQAAHQTGADAIHPGYGFLSERAAFAEAVEKAGITFVGPSPKSIHSMGDKLEAKRIAQAAGVSTVPGSEGPVADVEEAAIIAEQIGYPVMIKAAAGGGGKGMRVVHKADKLEEAIRGAVHEAGSSFGDNRVFLEKFITRPRHIEIQVLADKHGNIVTLGERECSIQRRHQKIIEEAPSPLLDEATREEMSRQVRNLAKEVGYFSAGTVEFVVGPNKDFYFLEMNTRLQVEHRVTELITGIDLVEMMLRVAADEHLPFTQEDVKLNGWAIQSRIYAEDPTRGFLPSVGRINRYQEPQNIPGMVLDTGVYEGAEVSMFYDPMVAKLCTFAETRERALEEMSTALGAYVIRGITHNINFLEAIISHPRFQDGDLTTHFIEEEYPEGFSGAQLTNESRKVFLAVGVFLRLKQRDRDCQITGKLRGHDVPFVDRWVVNVDDDAYPITVVKKESGYDITLEDETVLTVRSDWQLGRRLFQGTVNAKPVSVRLTKEVEGFGLVYMGANCHVKVRTPRTADYSKYLKAKSTTRRNDQLTAPIAGLVVGVRVKEGDVVKPGTELLQIEAMKMQNAIHADHRALIKAVHIQPGESVAANQLMIEFADAPAEEEQKAA